MLQKLQWDSFQQRRARSRVLMLYRIRTGFVGIPAAAYLEPVPSAPEGSKRDMCWFSAIQAHTVRHFFQVQSCCGTLWRYTVASSSVPPDIFETKLSSFRFIWAPDYVLFLSPALHRFYLKWLFIFCCMAFSIHICLFTRGAILVEFETAPLSEEAEDIFYENSNNTVAARKCLTRHGVKPVRRPFCFW